MELLNKINEAVENYVSESEKDNISEWERIYSNLDESQKSHIISLLIGKGIVKKDPKTGKLIKGDPTKVKDALSKLGIHKYKEA